MLDDLQIAFADPDSAKEVFLFVLGYATGVLVYFIASSVPRSFHKEAKVDEFKYEPPTPPKEPITVDDIAREMKKIARDEKGKFKPRRLK